MSMSSTSPVLYQGVAQASTATIVSSSKNPSKEGQSVTLTATVTSAYTTPSGNVTFAQGSTILGTATLAGGSARFTTSALPTGTDTVTATYSATTDFGGSSGSVIQSVN